MKPWHPGADIQPMGPGGTSAIPLLLPNGTAAAPALAFASDTDLGLYRYGSNTAALTSPIFYLGNAGMTQGMKFDTVSDGVLFLTDEAGGALAVSAGSFYWGSGGSSNVIGSIATLGGGGGIVRTPSVTGTSESASMTISTGNQSNVGNYSSGKLYLLTGATTTDGNTGNVEIYTGAAGAGIADAGDIIMSVNGAPGAGTTMLTLDASTTNSLFGAAIGVGWAGRDLLKSSADGVLLLTNAAGTQGLKLDTTTDGVLLMADESAAGLRVATVMGAQTLGAGATAIALTSNVMEITGNGGGNTVATITGGVGGLIATLIFKDALVTITDTAVGAVGANQVCLSAAFTGALGTTMQLVFNGTYWQELSRSVNG